MKTRCKFECTKIDKESYHSGALVTFDTRYCPEVAEDERFTKATPWGKMEVYIDNPGVVAALQVGAHYYIDISEA